MPELRKDPVLGRWIIIAQERGKRPSDFIIEKMKAKGASVHFVPAMKKLLQRKFYVTATLLILRTLRDGSFGLYRTNIPLW